MMMKPIIFWPMTVFFLKIWQYFDGVCPLKATKVFLGKLGSLSGCIKVSQPGRDNKRLFWAFTVKEEYSKRNVKFGPKEDQIWPFLICLDQSYNEVVHLQFHVMNFFHNMNYFFMLAWIFWLKISCHHEFFNQKFMPTWK